MDPDDTAGVAEARARIARVSWYHDFDFGRGLVARTSHEHPDGVRALWAFITSHLERLPFAGATVLDIGAWDGYWSFFAERRGARQVLATDDASQRWARDSGILLARELLGSAVDVRQDLPVYEVASSGRRFDIVLCLGVFYHLWDPLAAFAQIRHCCHPETLVVLEGEVARAGMVAGELRLRQSAWQECQLSVSALDLLLRLAYLRPVERVWMHDPAVGDGEGSGVQLDRCLTICHPFAGHNAAYVYRPHFGLHVYDDRFVDAVASDDLHANVVVRDCPTTVAPGAVFRATIEVRNTGPRRWRALAPRQPVRWLAPADPSGVEDPRAVFLTADGEGSASAVPSYRRFIEREWLEGTVALGVHLVGATPDLSRFDFARGYFTADLGPSEETTLPVDMRAPSVRGEYTITFEMVCEFVRWFGNGAEPAVRPLTVA